ncbi:MAG: tetratricopeptide repeat protein [Pirellulaceae bacterium]
MRRLNIKLILGLVIGGLGLVVGMHFTRGYMLSRNSERLLDRAAVAKEEGDLKEQVRLMKRYVGFHPKEQEKRRELLDVWFKYIASDEEAARTEFGPYYNALKKALRDFPEDDELRRNAGYLTYRMGEPATSLEFIRELGTLNANDHVLWAQCDLQGGKKFGSINRSADGDVIDQSSLGAFERLGMVIGFDTEKKEFVGEPMPDAPLTAYRILADSYHVSEQDAVTAQKIVDHMVAVNPESAVAYVTRAQFTQMVGRGSSDALQASMADVQKGLELDPDNPGIAVFASDIQRRLGEVDKSLALLEQAVEKHPKNVAVLEALANVKSSLGEKDEALNLIQRAMEVSSLNPDLMFMRASINLDSGDVAAAKETLSRLRQTGATPVQIGLLQARIQLAENNFVSASQTLERLNPAQNSQVRELLYKCYVRLGKTDKARELTAAAETSLNGSSSDASVIINRARLAQDSGDLQSALRNYQALWEKHQNMLTPEGKETIFKQMLDIRIELELAKDEKARDWSGVDSMVASWKTNPKLSRDDVELFEISIMNRKGNVREAMERVEQAKMRNPNYLAYWILHNTMITDHEQAMKVLNLMQQRFGDIAIVRRLKLGLFARIGTEDALAQAEQLLNGMDQFEKEDQQAIKRMAAEFNMRLKKFDRAIEIWQELKQANPTSLTLHAELLDLAIQAGNEPLITDTVNAIGELAGKDSSDWQLAEAQRIIWQVQNERRDASAIAEIKRLLADVQRLRPDYPLLYKALADLAILEKDPQAAFNALQTGLQKSTGNTRYVFLKQLGSLLTQMGRVQEGQHFLQQLPEEMRGRQDELTALVILAQRDPKAALQKAQESISQDTTNPRELSMLADLYFVNEQYDQTAALMKRATELDPKSPQAWQRRATMLVQMDRKDEVDALLPSIQANLEDPKKSLVLGQINAVLKLPR